MPFVDQILAPVDFSPPSNQGASYANVLAERLSAELTLLHVADPLTFDYSLVGPTQQLLDDMTRERLASRREQLTTLDVGETTARREMATGNAAEEILALSRRTSSDLIVMATRGANPIQRVFGLGSVTLQVLDGAECPVLTGTHFAEPPHVDGGRIICALDINAAEPALQWAHRATHEFGARLTVVHAIRFAEQREIIDGDWINTLRRRLEQRFTALLAKQGVDADLVIEEGNPREVVADTARSLGAALVVIGRSSAHDTLGRLRANSFDIIRRSPCPVVSV